MTLEKIDPNQPLGPNNPFQATTFNEMIDRIRDLEAETDLLPLPVGNDRRDGLVKTYTAPTWDNDNNEITNEGTVEVWPFKSDGSIDRTADPIELEHRLPMKTSDVPQGAYIVWDSQGIVVLTCNTYEGFS